MYSPVEKRSHLVKKIANRERHPLHLLPPERGVERDGRPVSMQLFGTRIFPRGRRQGSMQRPEHRALAVDATRRHEPDETLDGTRPQDEAIEHMSGRRLPELQRPLVIVGDPAAPLAETADLPHLVP